MKKTFIGLVVLYQLYISPYLLPRCRFYPTCSEYMKQALFRHGVFKGFVLTIFRLCRCNPFFEGGFDPVSVKNKKDDA